MPLFAIAASRFLDENKLAFQASSPKLFKGRRKLALFLTLARTKICK
jgi:hypothetical protein